MFILLASESTVLTSVVAITTFSWSGSSCLLVTLLHGHCDSGKRRKSGPFCHALLELMSLGIFP